MNQSQTLNILSERIDNYISKLSLDSENSVLKESINYALSIGGKRIRPILLLMTYSWYKDTIEKALNSAIAIEVLHNSTLIHDDIMDNADIRRGLPTVHKKWNKQTAILTGDIMISLSMKLLMRGNESNPNILSAIKELNELYELICLGQQQDIDLEEAINVSTNDYLEMIGNKTAAFLGASMKIGAILSDADILDCNKAYEIGFNMGMAFQIQDDYSDVFSTIYKGRIGGDIAYNKKTYLLINTIEKANDEDKLELEKLLSYYDYESYEKINTVIALYKKYKIDELALNEIKKRCKKCYDILSTMNIDNNHKNDLVELLEKLTNRTQNIIEFKRFEIINNNLNDVDFEFNSFVKCINFKDIDKVKAEAKIQEINHLINKFRGSVNLEKIQFLNQYKKRMEIISTNEKIKVFISYAHTDKKYVNRLYECLTLLKRDCIIELWNDQEILVGKDWSNEIYGNMQNSEIAIMLISSAFLKSDFCYEKEFKTFKEYHDRGTKLIIPIIIRPCSWQKSEIGKIQVAPENGLPITKWKNKDDAWLDVEMKISKSISDFKGIKI